MRKSFTTALRNLSLFNLHSFLIFPFPAFIFLIFSFFGGYVSYCGAGCQFHSTGALMPAQQERSPCWCLWSGCKVWSVCDWALGSEHLSALNAANHFQIFKWMSEYRFCFWHLIWITGSGFWTSFFDNWCILFKLMETERNCPGCAPRITSNPLTIHFISWLSRNYLQRRECYQGGLYA